MNTCIQSKENVAGVIRTLILLNIMLLKWISRDIIPTPKDTVFWPLPNPVCRLSKTVSHWLKMLPLGITALNM